MTVKILIETTNKMGYSVQTHDKEAMARIESIKVFCPKCGEEAKLIWSIGNGYRHASWHCCCEASEKNGWTGWWTADPEQFREKPQRFKTLFDF